MSTDTVPEGLTFTPSNEKLSVKSVNWTRVPSDFPCGACRDRGGWMPNIYQDSCPECLGEDEYGEPAYCGECEWCCGC